MTAGAALRICCCETIGTDLRAALSGWRCGAADCRTFVGRCGRPPLAWDEVRQLFGGHPGILVGGECLARLGAPPADLQQISLLQRPHCAELLCGGYTFGTLTSSGGYAVTPGWLRNWRAFIDGWGFDRATAAGFFAESCASIALVDTGSDPRAPEHLKAFGEFVGRRVEVVPVGLELLGLQLERAMAELERKLPGEGPEQTAVKPLHDSDFAMLLEMLSAISTAGGEERVIEEMLAFFSILFGASEAVFIPARSGEPLLRNGRCIADDLMLRAWAERLQAEHRLFDEPHGFMVRLSHNGPLGCLWVGGFVTPQHVYRYLNIAAMAAKVCALAVFSAQAVQESLRESEEKYRLLFEHMVNGFALYESVCDEAGVPVDYRFVEVNPAFEAFTGKTAQQLVGRKLREIFPNLDPSLLESLGELARDGAPVRLERYSIDLKKHYQVWIYRPRPGCFATILNDITQQKLLEEKLRQSIKMESVGRLAGGVAHDFNNMLSVIIGYAELLDMEYHDNKRISDTLGEICKAAEHSRDITAQLLAFSRQQLISPKIIDAADTLREMGRNLPALVGAGTEITLELSEELWKVRIDPTQLEQIVTNLALNAAAAMPEGGKLTIATLNSTVDEAGCAESLDAAAGEYVQLIVTDSGHGMDRETRLHIFEPFFTTREVGQGSGLGLATIYGIVTQNHGFVTVSSEPGGGSTFNIFLPRYRERGAEVREMKFAKGSGTVLLIEDDDIVGRMTAKMLEHMGYAVLLAESPAEAVEICSQERQIDLVISDVVMPGMSGREAVDRILALRPGVRVLYMSGYSPETVREKGVDGSAPNFIQKPFDINALNDKIKAALGEPARAGG